MSEQNEQERAVWSRPSGPGQGGASDYVVVPPAAAGGRVAAGSRPIVRASHPDHPAAPAGLITPSHDVSAPPAPDRAGGLFRRRDPIALGDFGGSGTGPPGGGAPGTG
ncbi:MAG: hypothetical protein WCA46_04205, partial [Actinocatenispora sp.]